MIAKKIIRYISSHNFGGFCTFFYEKKRWPLSILVFIQFLFFNSICAQEKDSIYLKNTSYIVGEIKSENQHLVEFTWKNIDTLTSFQIPKTAIYKLIYSNKISSYSIGSTIQNNSSSKHQNQLYKDFPLTRTAKHFSLGAEKLSFGEYKKFLESKKDSALNKLVVKIKREEKLQRNLLIAFSAIEVPAALLAVVYISSIAFDGIGVVGVVPNKTLFTISCSISGANLATLATFIVFKRKKNIHRLQAAKLYNQNYFNNKYGSFD